MSRPPPSPHRRAKPGPAGPRPSTPSDGGDLTASAVVIPRARPQPQYACKVCAVPLSPFFCRPCLRKMSGQLRAQVDRRRAAQQSEQRLVEAAHDAVAAEISAAQAAREALAARREALQDRLRRVRFLREQLARQKGALEDEQAQLAAARAAVDARTAGVEDLRRVLDARPDLPERPQAADNECKQAEAKLQQRRRHYVQDFLSLVPVNPISEKQCQIVNVPLPNHGDYSDLGMGVTDAAMGIVVHLVVHIAKYLRVHLPNTMVFSSSESWIGPRGCREDELFPLFLRRTSLQDFQSGVACLNENIVALAFSQGLEIVDPQEQQSTLLNIVRLRRLAALGRPGPILEFQQIDGREPVQPILRSTPRRRSGSSSEGGGDDDDDDDDWDLVERPLPPPPDEDSADMDLWAGGSGSGSGILQQQQWTSPS